jgi:hypothetical protein
MWAMVCVEHTGVLGSDVVRSGAMRSGAMRSGAVRSDTVRSGVVRSSAVRSGAVRSDAVRSDAVRSDTVRSDTVRSDTVRSDTVKQWVDYMMMVFVPLWYWVIPYLCTCTHSATQDDQVVMTSGVAQQYMYTHYLSLVVFIPLLRVERQVSFSTIGKVLLSGIGCGLIHHTPLLYWGMSTSEGGNEYDSIIVLLVSVVVEWPSIMCGVVYCTHWCCASNPRLTCIASKREQSRGKFRRGIIFSLFCVFLAMFLPKEFWSSLDINKLKLDDQFYKLLPYMSGQTFQEIRTGVIWTMTCSEYAPWVRSLHEECFESEDVLRVVATTAKGGSILGTKLGVVMGQACGKCVGAGHSDSDAWPGPVESNPDYDSDILLAVENMLEWPAYAKTANKSVQCVVITRHPLARLRSLYLYARNGIICIYCHFSCD